MVRRLFSLLAFSGLLLFWSPFELRGAELVGQVTDADTGEPVASAIVRAIPLRRNDREVQARTGMDGRYQLDLLRGKYRLFVSVPNSNYLPSFYTASGESQGDILDVATFQSFRIINLTVAAGGSISGIVRRSVDQAPVANIRIQAISKGFRTATNTRTDGSYVLQALPPGSYRVQVLPLDENFISHFYGNTRDTEKATVITLSRQERANAIDFHLRYGGVISGRAYAHRNREPIAGLRIIAENQSQSGPPYFTITDAQGFYTLRGLTEGSYSVETNPGRDSGTPNKPRKSFLMQFHEGRFDRELADRLEVESGSVFTGVNFAMVEGAAISGTVRSRYHNRPLSQVLLRSQNIARSVLNPFAATTDGEGNYFINDLPPGDYVVDTLLPEGIRRLVNFFYREKLSPEQADKVTLEEGERVRHIDFNLPLGGTIRGSLRTDDPDYALSPVGKRVRLRRQGADIEGFGRKDFKLKPDGSFLIERTPPGLYSLQPVLDDPNLIPQSNARERVVDVTEGSMIEGIEFPLNVVGSITGSVISLDKSSLEKVVLMVVNMKDNIRNYFELPSERYTVPGLEPGKYFMVLLTKPDPNPSPNGFPTGQVFDMRAVEVQRGKTTSGINLQLPIESNSKPFLAP